MARRLLLVRHGESEWNALGRWQGQADPPLSELGREQARVAVHAAALEGIDAVVSSPLRRAHETATIIADGRRLGSIAVYDDLKERDAGEWSGLTRAEIEERYPGWLEARADAHSGFAGHADADGRRRPPGWEGDAPLLARALGVMSRVSAEVADATVLVVTHGGVVYQLERHLGAPFARMANLEGRWIVVDDDGGLTLGDRVRLVDPAEVAVTIPDQL